VRPACWSVPGLHGNGPGHATVADLPSCWARVTWWWSTTPECWPAAWIWSKATGGRAEVLLLEPVDAASSSWEALVRPGRRLPDPTSLFEHGSQGGPPVVEVGRPVAASDAGRRVWSG
jgi:hypothetical protein